MSGEECCRIVNCSGLREVPGAARLGARARLPLQTARSHPAMASTRRCARRWSTRHIRTVACDLGLVLRYVARRPCKGSRLQYPWGDGDAARGLALRSVHFPRGHGRHRLPHARSLVQPLLGARSTCACGWRRRCRSRCRCRREERSPAHVNPAVGRYGTPTATGAASARARGAQGVGGPVSCSRTAANALPPCCRSERWGQTQGRQSLGG